MDSSTDVHADTTKVWKIFSLASALLGAAVAKKGMTAFWQKATGKNPPANPADPDVSIGEAVLWAAVIGTLIGVARMLATRRAAHYYAKSTGHLPPQLEKDDQEADKAPAAQS